MKTAKNLISLKELCAELSVSLATGKNWLRLGRLTPSTVSEGAPFFSSDYVKALRSELKSGSVLKSRRNKKHIFGNSLYSSYVSDKSKNLSVIESLLENIKTLGIDVTDELILTLLADCAVKLISHKYGQADKAPSLKKYLSKDTELFGYDFLADDLLKNVHAPEKIIDRSPELFCCEYTYERDEDIPGLLYISLKNLGSRKSTGAYYTPVKIVKKLCARLFETNLAKNRTILDPCCGTGNFLLSLPNEVSLENIYGNDIDKTAVKLARINLALKYEIKDERFLKSHITARDFLSGSFNEKFDYIIGNPPWGYAFSEEDKGRLRKKYASAVGANIESYDVFTEKSLSCLNPGGALSFVLPEAILNVKAHTPIREILMKKSAFQYLELLGEAFEGVSCPCVILQASRSEKPFDCVGLTVNDGARVYTISESRKITPDCFSFLTDDEEYKLLTKIGGIENKATLAGNALFALGIVTGNNKKFISREKSENSEIIVKGSDLRRFRYTPSGNYITFTPELFQQTSPAEYYRAPEKLLYRFICNKPIFAYDNSGALSLNSCNILIPQIEGLDIKYILAILNSSAVQFFCQKTFNSLKVLRSHIEQIPIPLITKKEQAPIIRKTDEILASRGNTEKTYSELDEMVSALYGLNRREHELIRKAERGDRLL